MSHLKRSKCGCALLRATKPMPLPAPLEHQHALRLEVKPGPLFVGRRWLVRDDHVSFDAIGESPLETGGPVMAISSSYWLEATSPDGVDYRQCGG
jgi:hypothetical protein